MEFLSEDWFAKVKELREAAGELNIPEQLSAIVINVNVEDMGREMHMKGGDFYPGADGDAAATIILNKDMARKLFLENDYQAGMQAFMAGELRVEGDVTKVMELNTVQPSAEQKALLAKIQEITD